MSIKSERICLRPGESFRLLSWKTNVREVEAIAPGGVRYPFEGSGCEWHVHPDMELVLVVKGNGTRFIGDSIQSFASGDLVLTGSNLPHYWLSREAFSGLALQFNFPPGHHIWKFPETDGLRSLLTNAQRGLLVTGKAAQAAAALVKAMPGQRGPLRLAGLLSVLQIIQEAAPRESRPLSAKRFLPAHDNETFRGIQKALHIILDNYHEDLSFADILSASGMSKATFERQFKKNTGKTYTAFLTEVRIDAACRQLAVTSRPVSEIAFACGFNDISYFNHRFTALRGMAPRTYRSSMAAGKNTP